MSAQQKIPVLIVGAGPSGLALALWLKKSGIGFRIIDKAATPLKNSCAVMIHARTLEFYRQLGIADEIIAAGRPVSDIRFHFNKRGTAPVGLKGQPNSTSGFPAMVVVAQDVHEKILIDKLRALNVTIERNLELKTFTQAKYQVESLIVGKGGEQVIISTYLCACDGSESIVRKILGVKFFKKSFHQDFFIADVVVPNSDAGSTNSININLSRHNASICIPLKGVDTVRLMGIVPKESENKDNLSFVNISDEITRGSSLQVEDVLWFSVYKVNQRVASHIRQSRAFLIGDAAHIHSPAFSQGMNAGIGDAINLSWKLAAVLKGQAASKILLTFETERIAFAERLNRISDRFFYFISGRNLFAALGRVTMMPLFIRIFRNFRPFYTYLYKFLSQTGLHYRESLLSEGSTGRLRAGDRLPWLRTDTFDNYDCLNSMAWHIQIYGDTHSNFNSVANFRGFRIFEFTWSKEAEALGFARDAFYLIRPDGHIALCDLRQNTSVLKAYLNDWDIDHSRNVKAERSPDTFQLENQI